MLTLSPAPWIMESSRNLRLGSIFLLYVAQGIPVGLFWFAIPAWMTSNGADARDVAWVLGLTALPWTLKFINGFVMDRYSFLPMGRRRGWVLGAQLVMVLTFLVAALIAPTAEQVLLLGVLSFIGNAATTFQDVGIDGMAVDLLPEHERARGGGMMFGGQLIGTALATAGTGWAITRFGASGAYLAAALAISLVTAYLVCVRERAGERTWPWSEGVAHPRNLELNLGRWWPVLSNTRVSLTRSSSLFWVLVLVCSGTGYGVMAGVTPLIGTGPAGLSEAQVTGVVGAAQLIAGFTGLLLGSWLGERLGSRRSQVLMLSTWIALNLTMTLTVHWWSSGAFFQFFVIAWFSIQTVLTVVSIPISMRLCDPRVAATQFTIYMALTNLGISLGALLLGMSDRLGGLVSLFPILAGIQLLAIVILVLVKFPRRTGTVA